MKIESSGIFHTNSKFNLYVDNVILLAIESTGIILRYYKKINTPELPLMLYYAYAESKLKSVITVCGNMNVTTEKRIKSV